jgi:hypothetical protein
MYALVAPRIQTLGSQGEISDGKVRFQMMHIYRANKKNRLETKRATIPKAHMPWIHQLLWQTSMICIFPLIMNTGALNGAR